MRLAAQGSIQRAHRAANRLGIAGGIGCLKRFGCLQHGAVARTQSSIGLLALGGFAVEGLINRFAKGIPQLLLKAAVQRHGMGFGLPALLQGFDGINPHHRHGTQHLGLFNHGLALLYAEFLQRFQRGRSLANGCQPQRLHLGKGLFAQVARVAPAVAKLMQDAVKALPVVVQRRGVGGTPGLDFFDQRQALCLVFGRFELDPLQPRFDHFVGLIAGLVKALPQAVVGHTALIGLLPLLAQGAQVLLHLASTQLLPALALEQPFGLSYQLFAQLIGTPALPALQLARSGQRGVGLVLQLVANQATKFFERTAQRVGCPGTGFAVAFGYLQLQLGQYFAHSAFSEGFDFRVDFGFGRLGRCFNRHATRGAKFIRPLRHGRQRRSSIAACGHGLRQCGLKRIPHHQQLRTRGIQQRRKLHIHTAPIGICLQRGGLVLPMADIDTQGLPHGLRIAPGLHRQHFNALRQQHRRLALHLHAVLQIFDDFDALGQLALER